MVLARIYGLYSTTYLILLHGRLSAYDPTILVLAPLKIQLSTEPTQNPIITFTKPRPVRLTKRNPILDRPTTPSSAPPSASPSLFPAKNPSDPPGQGPFQVSNQTTFWTPQTRYPGWGPYIISNQTSFHIYQLGSITNLPRKPPCPDLRSHLFPAPENFHHNTPDTRHLQNHTYRIPFYPPNLPSILYSHQQSLHSPHPYPIKYTEYTRPRWRPHRSHCTCHQGWIPLPDSVPDSVVYSVVCSG